METHINGASGGYYAARNFARRRLGTNPVIPSVKSNANVAGSGACDPSVGEESGLALKLAASAVKSDVLTSTNGGFDKPFGFAGERKRCFQV